MNMEPDVRELIGISTSLKSEYIRDGILNPWADSPFAWILGLPSRQKGTIGERLVASWCTSKGLDVIRSHNSDADRIIEGSPVEIKFSTLWSKAPLYKFQQIRDQDYEYAICLGISPFTAHCWVIPKDVIMRHATSQHGGSRGHDTRWLTVYPNNPTVWLEEYGGTLETASKVLLGIATHDRELPNL
jgi:hypothetical protein